MVELFPGQPTRVVTRVTTLRRAGQIALGLLYLLGAVAIAAALVVSAIMLWIAGGPIGLLVGAGVALMLNSIGRGRRR